MFQTDHTEELEELCQAANHLNESGGESGGEFWLHTDSNANNNPTRAESNNKDTTVTTTDLLVI